MKLRVCRHRAQLFPFGGLAYSSNLRSLISNDGENIYGGLKPTRSTRRIFYAMLGKLVYTNLWFLLSINVLAGAGPVRTVPVMNH